MEHVFSLVEIRIIGTLIEKQITTPEYYPLTLNALVNGCNQKSNRHPVMSVSEDDVIKALNHLQLMGMAQKLLLSNSRSERYKHLFDEKYRPGIQEKSVLCELFIRGAQTVGELRTHTERMFPIASLDDVQKIIDELLAKPDGPYVVRLERQPGQKECRYAHLFCGMPEAETIAAELPASALPESRRIALLEEKVAMLAGEIQQLKEQIAKLGASR